jgi:hypothetical protein
MISLQLIIMLNYSTNCEAPPSSASFSDRASCLYAALPAPPPAPPALLTLLTEDSDAVDMLLPRRIPISKLPVPELLLALPDNLSLIVSLSAAIPLQCRRKLVVVKY